jgi:hypothetical protein
VNGKERLLAYRKRVYGVDLLVSLQVQPEEES